MKYLDYAGFEKEKRQRLRRICSEYMSTTNNTTDTDNNNDFTGGSFFPLKASEWFYEYPDTFQIRANWEIDVGQIEKE